MIAIYGERAVFVDGRIETSLIEMAAEDGNIKRFFNRRFHDKGVEWQRLVYFQTVSTRRWGEKRKRGIANLHFHALMILPERQTNKQIRATLETVFGKAGNMGKLQFKISKPDWQESYSFNGVRAGGPIGKILYVQQGMGGTFNDLHLNEGKRSRKAPIERLRCNRQAKGLARGIPSNFNFKAALCDHVSMDAGRRAFLTWLKEERELERQRKMIAARERAASGAKKDRATNVDSPARLVNRRSRNDIASL
ncbi:hypothetical protein [Neorhizobium sp. NCHU2750]|uniref:hypothetical protein n=1 Tax=Neorhizobium sp. NCHU2750 TaxID=1825976 RepID=UPI000EB680BD|nr:hypothetical protein NCHU2750_59560 [Neorhizobium sp. NCHU2750]